MQDSQYIKWKLEQVWNTGGCRCPNNLVQWHLHQTGYQFWWHSPQGFWTVLIYYKPGLRRVSKRGCKPRGKGFSFLSKGYGLVWTLRQEERQAKLDCTCHIPHSRPWWWCKVHGEVTVPVD